MFLVDRENFSTSNLISSVLYSVVTALLISLFYDLFTRAEQKAEQEINNEQVFLRLERSRINVNLLMGLSNNELSALARELSQTDQFLTALANATSTDPEMCERLTHSHFRPLFASEKLCRVNVENTIISARDQKNYQLHCKFKFMVAGGKRVFRCVITPDNDIINDVIITSHLADEIIGLSDVGWDERDDLLACLKMTGSWVGKGKRHTEDIRPTILTQEEASERYPNLRGARYLVLEYELHTEPKCEYLLEYRVKYSLNDNYYCWFATVPMFAERVTINYAGAKDVFGKVSAQCFIGNNSGESKHHVEECSFEITVGGLLWPGQGGLIVWRGPLSSVDIHQVSDTSPKLEKKAATPKRAENKTTVAN